MSHVDVCLNISHLQAVLCFVEYIENLADIGLYRERALDKVVNNVIVFFSREAASSALSRRGRGCKVTLLVHRDQAERAEHSKLFTIGY